MSCKTLSFAPIGHGIRTCRAVTAGVGYSRFVATCPALRERARPTVELDATELDAVAAGSLYSAVVREGFDEVFARLDLAPAIATALQKIPEPFRSTLIIVDVEDQSYESAAEVLGVPIGTVRSRLFRGRRLMQEQLLTYASDAGFGPRAADAGAPTKCLTPAVRTSHQTA